MAERSEALTARSRSADGGAPFSAENPMPRPEKMRSGDFDKVYALMERSFPADEIRTRAEQRALLELANYHIGVIYGPGDDIAAFIAVRVFASGCYIEHFAAAPELRGRGYGSHILRELISRSSGRLFLEVEPPDTAEAVRRIDFYRRNGFVLNDFPYIQPPISAGRRPLPLKIMSYGRELGRTEFEGIKALLYSSVYRSAVQPRPAGPAPCGGEICRLK